jgi:hypothetical protein
MIRRLFRDIKTCIWAYANLRRFAAQCAAMEKLGDRVFTRPGSYGWEKASLEYEAQRAIVAFWNAIMEGAK